MTDIATDRKQRFDFAVDGLIAALNQRVANCTLRGR
jgi:hypothetical protein